MNARQPRLPHQSSYTSHPIPHDRLITTRGLMIVTQRGRGYRSPVGVVLATGEEIDVPGRTGRDALWTKAPAPGTLVALEAKEHGLADVGGVPLVAVDRTPYDPDATRARQLELFRALMGRRLLDRAGHVFEVEELVHHLHTQRDRTLLANCWSVTGTVRAPNPEATVARAELDWTSLTFDFADTPATVEA
jgi:hypothetical protein